MEGTGIEVPLNVHARTILLRALDAVTLRHVVVVVAFRPETTKQSGDELYLNPRRPEQPRNECQRSRQTTSNEHSAHISFLLH